MNHPIHKNVTNTLPITVISKGNSVEGPSVFECQLRIFDKWFRQWTQEDKAQFASMLAEVDPQNTAACQQGLS